MSNKNNLQLYDFKEFLYHFRISYQAAQTICQVHRTTFNRWLDGTTKPPHAVYELLRLHATGEPPCTDNTWHDWRFENNLLTCIMTRRCFTPTDILMIPTLEIQARELRNIKENYALQSKLF